MTVVSDSPLIRINKKEAVKISWSGNEECFTKNQQNFMNALGNGSFHWFRESKTFKFPLNLQFAPSFQPFNSEQSIIKSTGYVSEYTSREFAFVHVYLIYVANFEEYRITVRPDVSEWFSNLNEANCTHWFIIFDSSRAKEKKSRTQIMDKLKNDFARFQNKLFESSDISSEKSLALLTSFFQNSFIASLENYVNLLTKNISALKNMVNESSFSPSLLINEQFQLCLFYWNFGLYEIALNELDQSEAFFTDTIQTLVRQNNEGKDNGAFTNLPNWIKKLRLLPLDKCCNLLYLQMFSNLASEDWSFVKMHCHFLAHQILLSAHLLNQKLSTAIPNTTDSLTKNVGKSSATLSANRKSNVSVSLSTRSDIPTTSATSQTVDDQQPHLNTLQIRHNSVCSVLRYAHERFQMLEEHFIILKANYNPVLLHCLFIIWQAEVFKFCELLLGDYQNICDNNNSDIIVSSVESASTHINFLLHKKCEAMLYLHSMFSNKHNQQEMTIVRRWLEQTSFTTVPFADTQFTTKIFQQFAENFDLSDNALKFEKYAKQELINALNIFERFNWVGHIQFIRSILHNRFVSSTDTEDMEQSYRFAIGNIKQLIAGNKFSVGLTDAFVLLQSRLDQYRQTMYQKDKDLLFDCYIAILILSKEQKRELQTNYAELLMDLLKFDTSEIIRNNLTWLNNHNTQTISSLTYISCNDLQPVAVFPFAIKRICSSSLLHCFLQQPVLFELDILNHLPFELANCVLSAKFYKISTDFPLPEPRNIFFQQSSMAPTAPTAEQKLSQFTYYNLDCIAIQNEIGGYDDNKTTNRQNLDQFEAVTSIPFTMQPGTNRCKIQIKAEQITGCFWLHSIQIKSDTLTNCIFMLYYLHEIRQNFLLEHFLCFVDVLEPNISVYYETEGEKDKKSQKYEIRQDDEVVRLAAGIEQHFEYELSCGTIPINKQTSLVVSFVDIENQHLKFKNITNGEWLAEPINYTIPPIASNTKYHVEVTLCKGIDQITSINDDKISNDKELFNSCHEVQIDWLFNNGTNYHRELIVQKFIKIQFTPIMTLRSGTSLLGTNIIFILDIQRKRQAQQISNIKELVVFPIDICLRQEQSIALEPVEAQLLNSRPLQPIVFSACSRFIWKLPDYTTGKSVAIPHFLRLRYRVKQTNKEKDWSDQHIKTEEFDDHICQQEYLIEKRMDFPLQKVEYEICARFYYEQSSQSVLCRIDQPCDLIVSLRALAKLIEAQTVIVNIETDPMHWVCSEKHKLARLRDSGVGQAIFTIVPKMLGYIPFPSISIRKYNLADISPSRQQSINEKHFGEPLLAFYRNRGSQIHILGPLHSSDETVSVGGSSTNTAESSEHKKKSLKTQAKDRLQKLFE